MKYELETIPVWDALKADGECPFCHLAQVSREYYASYYLGSSVMNPETRVKVNEAGFCSDHFFDLAAERKAHSLGLITHTYLKEYQKKLDPPLSSLKKRCQKLATKKGQLSFPKDVRKRRDDLFELLESIDKTCLICDGLERSMKRYLYTLTYLWKSDSEFRSTLKESKGFCMVHLKDLLPMAEECLKPAEALEFMGEVLQLQEDNLERLERELDWFNQKFDAQNSQKPWDNSKNAHKRTIEKLIGRVVPQD